MLPPWRVIPLQALLLLLATGAEADWPPAGRGLCEPRCLASLVRICADGAGGAYVAWRDSRDYPITDDDVYLQRVTASGDIAPGWPAAGLPVCVAQRAQHIYQVVPDGFGGALMVWIDFRNGIEGSGVDLYAQRVLGEGVVAPGWAENGVPVVEAPGRQSDAWIVADGLGGSFVVWSFDDRVDPADPYRVWGQHLTVAGTTAPGWPADGLPICTEVSMNAEAIPDGTGGVLVAWTDRRRFPEGGHDSNDYDLYGLRLTAAGTIAPGWVENGNRLLERLVTPRVVADEQGGFYVAGATSSTVSPGFEGEYWLTRHRFDGTRAEGWPDGGVRFCAAPNDRAGLQLAGDGMGGLLATWYDYRPPESGGEIYATRILPDDSLAPGWTESGTRVSDPTGSGTEDTPFMVRDEQGGAYVTWERSMGSPIQHLTAAGALAPGWPPFGLPLAAPPSAPPRFAPRLVADGIGGAIVAWEEAVYPERSGVYAMRFGADGPTAVLLSLLEARAEPEAVELTWAGAGAGSIAAWVERRSEGESWRVIGSPDADGADRLRFVDRAVVPGGRYAYRLGYRDEGVERHTEESWVEVPGALRLALEGLRPNPATADAIVSFTLPSAEPATLELLDVAGRRIVSRAVGALGSGRHVLRLGNHLAAGIYVVRLRTAAHTLSARGVILR